MTTTDPDTETLAQRADDIREALRSDSRYALAMAQCGAALDRGDDATAAALHRAAEVVRRSGRAQRDAARAAREAVEAIRAAMVEALALLRYAVAERDDVEAHATTAPGGRGYSAAQLAAARDAVREERAAHDALRVAHDAAIDAYARDYPAEGRTP